MEDDSSSSEVESIDELVDDTKDTTQIRAELTSMSFEDLQKLKEKLGAKVFNEAMFDQKQNKVVRHGKTQFKRENKNRPREMSSKRPQRIIKNVAQIKKVNPRDPRFDPLCGSFNEKAFKHSYSFVTEIKESEIADLKKELQETEDEERKEQISYLIKRLKNQIMEKKKLEEKEQKRLEGKLAIKQALKEGKTPVYHKKSDKRVLDLVAQYEQLKKNGGLEKHIKRIRKKNATKDRKRLKLDM